MDTSNSLSPDQVQSFMAFMAAIWVVVILVAIAVRALFVWFFWRIFVKAGFNGAIGLINIIPLGELVCILILAFSDWPMAPGRSGTIVQAPTSATS